MKLSDEVIIRRCLEGDGNAFSLLVEKYQNAVYGLCYHIVGNFADAQDLTQESFIQAYLDLTQIKIPSKFASWLYRVTVNVCKMWLRNRKGIDSLPIETLTQTGEELVDTRSLEEHTEAEEMRISIRKAVSSLSEKNRLVITLYYIDGLSYDEIGDFLGLSESTIKSRLHRGRKQLKEELISMVEDDFNKHKLPEDFSEKVVQGVIVKAVRMAETKNVLQNLFSIGLQNQNDLASGKIPMELIDRLKNIQMSFSDNAIVSIQKPGDEWMIKDNEATFSIRKEGDSLNIYKSAISQVPVVLLQSKADEKQIMPIYIGTFEALAIIQQQAGVQSPRPMTHDLTLNILKEFGMKIIKVVITDLQQDTFYARITIESDGEIKEIDARPSDSIALALRAEAPIFVAKSVLSNSATTDDLEKFKPHGSILFDWKFTVK